MSFSFARSSSPAGAGTVTSTVWSASADTGAEFCTGSLADQLHGGDVRRQGGGKGRAVRPLPHDTPDARSVSCDVAFLPVGGTYTMTAAQAAGLAAALRPQIAVPTHYGCIVGSLSDGDTFAAALPPDISCVRLIR